MTTKLTKLKLGKNYNPEDLEEDIAPIKNDYRCQIDKKIRKALVVKAAGKYYANVIRNETLRKGSSMTAEDLIETMSKTYRIADGGDKEDSDDDVDSASKTVLVTGAFK